MSVRKLTTSLLTTLGLISGGQLAFAQNNNYLTPGDPFHMTPETAWFEPVYDADILDMKPEKRANTGWFGTIDKLNMYCTRPNLDDEAVDANLHSDRKLDDGGGTRYEFGFMLPDEDNGWLFSTTKLGVSSNDQLRINRIAYLNDEDLEGEPEFPAPRFGQDALLDVTGNNFGFNTRFYDVGRTLNGGQLNSYELMKTFRLEPYHYGGILEPMVGVRYVRFDDVNANSRYSRAFDPIDLQPAGTFNNYFNGENYQNLVNLEDPVEIYDTLQNRTRNDIFTAQVGGRYYKYAGRVRYSAEGRLFTGFSMQCSTFTAAREVTIYDGFDFGDDVVERVISQTNTRVFENDEFFIGFELRSEMSLQLTKMIQVRGGLQLIDLSKGVWRGGTEQAELFGGSTDQDFLAVGFTYGVELNR